MFIKNYLLIGFILGYAHLFSQDKADFLIIENPAETRILDRYQQSLNNSEKVLLYPNTPWLIETDSMTLSDQFTRAMKVSRNNQTYYILIDQDGRIITDQGSKEANIFRSCILVNDTLEAITDNKVFFSADFNNKGNALLNGTKLIRLFEYKNKSFVKILNSPRPYGWINFQAVNFKYREIQNIEATVSADTSFYKQIKEHVFKVNKIYKDFFSNFNKRYDRSISAPHWQIESDKKTITLLLVKGNTRTILQKSTQQLISNLQNILIGHPYRLSYEDSKIFIRPK